MEIVSSDSNRISYDQRELALGTDIICLLLTLFMKCHLIKVMQ